MSVNAVNSDGSLLRVAGGTLYADAPIGTISPFGGSSVPSGYLLCNGAEVLKTDYAELYTVIGDAFGIASDNTKFVLPDFRESVPVGVGENGTQTIVSHDTYTLGEFKDDQIQSHKHYIDAETTQTYVYNAGQGSTGLTSSGVSIPLAYGVKETNIPLYAREGANTHGKQLGVNYIIKAKQVAVPADFIDAINDVLKVSEPVSATNTEYTTNGSIVWKRSGNVVEVTFLNVAFASQTSGDVTLATGLPPSNNYSWSVIKSLTDTSVQQGVAVNTNGNLTSIGGSTGGSSYYDSFTYLAAD